MLTINMELWPFGDEERAKRLVTINIANVGPDAADAYTYDYIYTIDEPSPLFGDAIEFEGILKGYNREGTAVDILAAVLKDYSKGPKPLSNSDQVVVDRLRAKTLKIP